MREMFEYWIHVLAAKARENYAQWRLEKFESELASLLYRIRRPMQFYVSVAEVQNFLKKYCDYDAHPAECWDWIYRRMTEVRRRDERGELLCTPYDETR